MGSSCCRPKDDSPRVSLSKAFARLSHRVFPSSGRTCKIAEAEKRLSCPSIKSRPNVSEPVFMSSTIDDERNHVTLLLPEAPGIPPRKKKPRLCKKRVSFQSDVDIMSSTKSLDKRLGEAIAKAKLRRRSLDSLLLPADEEVVEPRPQRRSSSLEIIPSEDWLSKQAAIAALKAADTSLTARLRRDTLGNALDIHSYRRPLIETTLPGTVEEESDGSLEEISSGLASKLRRDTLATAALKKNRINGLEPLEDLEEEETESSLEDIALSALPLKIRRDTLGLALKKNYKDSDDKDVEDDDPSPLDSSAEDLAIKLNYSKFCSKLRRDTFGDALRQAVRSKACSSFEDITELEIDEPKLQGLSGNLENEELSELSNKIVDEVIKKALSIVEEKTPKREIEKTKSAWLNNILKEGETDNLGSEKNNNTFSSSVKKVTFTKGELASVMERMRGVQAKEPYTVVYTSPKPNEVKQERMVPEPKVDSIGDRSAAITHSTTAEAKSEKNDNRMVPDITVSSPNDPPSRKSSTTSSLQEFETSIYEMLQHEEEKDKQVSVES